MPKIIAIHEILKNTQNKSLFSVISPLHQLSKPPIPLTTTEMHRVSADLMRSLQQEGLVAFYKFSNQSDGGKAIINGLKDLAIRLEVEKQVVTVNVLINSRGKVAEFFYRPNENTALEQLETDYLKIKKVFHTTHVAGSLHSKFMIMDGRKAMIRGGDPTDANNSNNHYWETATLIQDEGLVAEMRREFNQLWTSYAGETIAPLLQEESIEENLNTHNIPCFFMAKKGNGNIFFPSTDAQAPYKIACLKAISEATTCVHVLTSNINDRDICHALTAACQRGVKVNILTGKYHNEPAESWWGGTNRHAIAEIVKHLPLEYHKNLIIRWATNNQGEIVKDRAPYSIHGKYMRVDDLVFVGSTPIDKQGLNYSQEADLVFEDKETADQFDAKFFNDKFNHGKDYFDDAFEIILQEIETQTQRIENSAHTFLRRTKAKNLRDTLGSFKLLQLDSHDKLFMLLDATLPLLAISTGLKPGMPKSYNVVIEKLNSFGLSGHLDLYKYEQQALPTLRFG